MSKVIATAGCALTKPFVSIYIKPDDQLTVTITGADRWTREFNCGTNELRLLMRAGLDALFVMGQQESGEEAARHDAEE